MLQILDATSFCGDTAPVWNLIGTIIRIIRIAIPIVIVLLGTIDLGKAVIAGEEKDIKAAQGIFIKRLIYGVLVFFVVWIVQAIFGLVSGWDENNEICWSCAANPNGATCTSAMNNK